MSSHFHKKRNQYSKTQNKTVISIPFIHMCYFKPRKTPKETNPWEHVGPTEIIN